MLTTTHVNANVEENDLSTYYIIPLDALKTSTNYAQLKIWPDRTVYVVDNENQQIEEQTEEITVVNSSLIQKSQHGTEKRIAPKSFTSTPESKYACLKCANSFKSIKDYKEHVKWHKLQKKFKCTKCQAGYDIENNLKIHEAMVHPTAIYMKSCPICGIGLTFKRAASLKSHLMVHQVEEVHSCEECDAEFEKEDEYVQHMMTHSTKHKEESSLTCFHCEVQFKTKHELKLHISDHTRAWRYFKKKKTKRTTMEKKYICKICSKSFIKQSLLDRHERIHSGEKPFKCNICEQSFTQKGTLQVHLMRHTGNKPFSCTLCPAKFNQKGNLRVHIKKTHTASTEGQRMYKCSHCFCIFKRVASLNGHVTKAHLKDKCTEENVIGDVMKNLKDLNQSNFDSYMTLTETKSDGAERKYVVQLKKVGDVKHYVCSYCPKTFKKPSDLIRHIRVHTKEKPFVCKVCRKAFTLKSALISHMRTHMSTKNYKCQHCDCSFTSLKLLNTHLKKHEAWHCMTCNVEFDEFEKALQHKMSQDESHKIQSITNKILKQPLYQTVYGNLVFKPPRPKIPNTGTESTVPRPFHCTICDARFTRKINLVRHTEGHEGNRKYKCNLCPKSFITAYRLKEHLNHHNNIKNYACKVCNKRFVTSTYLRRHIITHNNLRPYTCPYCSKNFQTLDMCRRHIKLVHKKHILAEELKEKTQTQLDDVNVSSQATSVIINNINKDQNIDDGQALDSNSIQAQMAPYTQIINTDDVEITDMNSGYQTFYVNLEDLQLINNGISLNSLVENVEATENYQLAASDPSLSETNEANSALIYTNAIQSQNDINLSTTGDPTTIFDGNTVFETSAGLSETKTIFDDASIICMHCNRMFSSFVQFQKHACAVNSNTSTNKDVNINKVVEVHEEIREVPETSTEEQTLETNIAAQNVASSDLTCPICNISFNNKLLYMKHTKTHACFECSKCKTVFTGKNEYLEHLASHKNRDSSHSCVFCMKKFKKPSDLERHHRTHTGVKPFDCHICNKKFSLKATLQCHIKTHDSNHKQFGCEICDSFYSSKTSLKVHMTIHTGVMPYKCSFCEVEFRTSGAKKSHETICYMGHRSGQKKKSKKTKLSDIFKAVTSELVPPNSNTDEIQNNVIPEYVPFENLGLMMNQNNLTTQTQALDFPSQIVNLGIPPETILSTIAEDQITVDPSNLLQQLEMTDMVLSANETGTVPSLILEDVSFLDLEAATNNLQIISLPETDGGGVTISIKERLEKGEKKSRPEKSKQVECDICLKTLASKDGLRKHKKNIHSDKKKLACLQNQEILEIEQKDLQILLCNICSMAFDSENSLETHIKSFHPVTEASKEETSALLNLKLDLQAAAIEDPLFNNLFLLKKI